MVTFVLKSFYTLWFLPVVVLLPDLRYGHIKKIDEFDIYLIWVYNHSRADRYFTFCSPSCAAAIDEYLDYRRRFGEEIKDKSPLIREQFNIDNPFTANAPHPITAKNMSLIMGEVLRRSGVNQIKVGNKRRDVMKNHGYRKFFINQCIRAGLTESVWKPLVGHRLPKTNAAYIRLDEEYLLAEYVKVIPFLSIDQTQSLKQENAELKKRQNDYLAELGELKEDFYELKQFVLNIDSKEMKRKLLDGFVKEACFAYQEEGL